MKKKLIMLVTVSLLLAGCSTVMNVLQTAADSGVLTEADVIRGLKEALTVGAKNSSSLLSAVDGYYKDAAVKIMLPDEAKVIVENISKIPGGEKLIENVVLSINRAAEDAAKDAAPVFVNSITSMTVTDGFNILRGADNAATMYLRNTTYNELYALYKPKIEASTKKDIIGTISTEESWNTLTSKWNTFANSFAGKIGGFKPVNTDLNDFLTRKALDGIFLKIANEELKIRKDVNARVTPLLQKVFGSVN
ncbi:MAG TPA: DUF4197 domain-containing protein [Bacteroidales bacterium]|nr:DUF4197 domain-containing protein [Bacteroidales bacterium]